MTLGEYIRCFREAQQMSQRQFAERAGVSNGYISMLERNANPETGTPITPTLPKLKQIAEAMNVTVHELCSQVDEMAVDLGTEVIGYDDAQRQLRIVLTEAEFRMLKAFQAADDVKRRYALMILEAE